MALAYIPHYLKYTGLVLDYRPHSGLVEIEKILGEYFNGNIKGIIFFSTFPLTSRNKLVDVVMAITEAIIRNFACEVPATPRMNEASHSGAAPYRSIITGPRPFTQRTRS